MSARNTLYTVGTPNGAEILLGPLDFDPLGSFRPVAWYWCAPDGKEYGTVFGKLYSTDEFVALRHEELK